MRNERDPARPHVHCVDCNILCCRDIRKDWRLEMSHTKEPWFLHREGFSTVYVEARIDGGLVQEVAACGPANEGAEQQEANARRIVACVNACAGIPTSDLEDQTFIGVSPIQAGELLHQRDKLLAALKEASEEYKRLPYSLGYDITHCTGWDAIIAEIEGATNANPL
jgi:hypothetical protein